MGQGYIILDWSRGVIIRGLSLGEVLTGLRILMKMPSPSFDVMEADTKKVVTSEFTEQPQSGYWMHTVPTRSSAEMA